MQHRAALRSAARSAPEVSCPTTSLLPAFLNCRTSSSSSSSCGIPPESECTWGGSWHCQAGAGLGLGSQRQHKRVPGDTGGTVGTVYRILYPARVRMSLCAYAYCCMRGTEVLLHAEAPLWPRRAGGKGGRAQPQKPHMLPAVR